MAYHFKSAGVFKNSYLITDNAGSEIGELSYNSWKTSATVKTGPDTINIDSAKWYSTRKVIIQNGDEVGQAEFKTFTFKPEIIITYRDRAFVLKATDGRHKCFNLYINENLDQSVGSVNKSNMWGTAYHTELPESISVWFQGVLVSLVISLENMYAAVAAG